MNQTARKFSAGAIGGAIATVILWGVEVWLKTVNPDLVIPPPVAGAIGSLFVTGASLLIPDALEEP